MVVLNCEWPKIFRMVKALAPSVEKTTATVAAIVKSDPWFIEGIVEGVELVALILLG